MKLLAPILTILFIISINFTIFSQDQQKDKAKFEKYRNEYWQKIKNSSDEYNKKEPGEVFKMDFSGYSLPTAVDQFAQQWYNLPISQGWTGTCWCFSTTSYLESEIYRVTNQKLKLSEMFTVYWEYVRKQNAL